MGQNGKNGKDGKNGNGNGKGQPFHFANRLIADIPHGRKGKHDLIVSKIIGDLEKLDSETAILVPLDGLDGEKMANVRSALNRATKGKKMSVATSTDEKYFYVWRTDAQDSQPMAPPARSNGAVPNGKMRG
jgi:hypothetical protein